MDIHVKVKVKVKIKKGFKESKVKKIIGQKQTIKINITLYLHKKKKL